MYREKYSKLCGIYNKSVNDYISDDSQPIYHYTSPEGLNGIISNNTLRFTDRNYLNDYSEGRYVMKLCIDEHLEEMLEEPYNSKFITLCDEFYKNPLKKKTPTFQCSFSMDDDSLPMWNYYSKNDGIKGYSVGFFSKALINNIKTNSYKVDVPSEEGLKIRGGKVVYDKNRQIEITKKIINDFAIFLKENIDDKDLCNYTAELLVEKLILVGSFFKHNCFEYEKEYRLIINPRLEAETEKYLILNMKPKMIVKNGLLIPIIDLEFKKETLKKIKISPTLDFDETTSNLLNALDTYSYSSENINITHSDIPVRY